MDFVWVMHVGANSKYLQQVHHIPSDFCVRRVNLVLAHDIMHSICITQSSQLYDILIAVCEQKTFFQHFPCQVTNELSFIFRPPVAITLPLYQWNQSDVMLCVCVYPILVHAVRRHDHVHYTLKLKPIKLVISKSVNLNWHCYQSHSHTHTSNCLFNRMINFITFVQLSKCLI